MPSRQDEDQSRVLVSGLDEERVLDCIEKLRSLEDEFMEDFASHAQYQYQRPQVQKEVVKQQNVEIRGAPWQLNNEQFPSMNGNDGQQIPTAARGVWGRR